jgi:hypothetical protein
MMSETQPSPESTGGTDKKHRNGTILRALAPGDRVVVDDRARPLTVAEVRTRQPSLVDGDTTQTVVVAAGEWDRAADVTLHEELHIRGELTGAIVDDAGREHTVRRADR